MVEYGTFSSNQPIYLQIVQKVCHQIARGQIEHGEKLPSVREMAVKSSVNPNTIQRVYQELERMELVETRRGQGTFITDNKQRLIRLRQELMEERIAEFLSDMVEMGFTADEILANLQTALSRHTNS